ncbi:CDP-glycerol glycerophosphotransferase family protein [Sporolactobacillus sp. Y61]|uniref:CDP-glycerol glycerophosphotransferase family protein n=1 Tax=Sporolactobacillus sp. Y61 TaxID=3160863 RepID=A0AAU8ID29_9BACL
MRKHMFRAIKGIVQKLYTVGFAVLGKLPVKRRLIVFESFFGRQYSCNPRAIYEYMHVHCPDCQLIWSAARGCEQIFEKHDIPYVRRYSLRWLLFMTQAGYWVTNIRYPDWFRKPAHTIFLQTWHGTPLKRLALDIEEWHEPGVAADLYKKQFKKDSAMWDYLISPNHYSSKIFRRAFGFKGTLVESGYPRNDILYQANRPAEIEQLKKECGLPRDRKVILYAPTWRDDQFYDKGKYKFRLALDLDKMQEALGKDYIILLRLHYLVADHLDLSDYHGFVYDFSKFEDIRGLYLLSDLLITDYSSVFFDYANLHRPMIFFAYDLDQYRDHLRGFYFDYEKKAPGPIVQTTDGVLQAIHTYERTEYRPWPNFEAFYRQFCALENGSSSQQVVRRVFKKV